MTIPDPFAVPPGEWHMYRRDHRLSGRSLLPGNIDRPGILWSYPLGGSENESFPIAAGGGRMDLLFAYGGCVVRTDGTGAARWRSQACGLNAIGAVVDLDGDGRLEIVCSTGYEVVVLASESGEILMRHYVGFPLSAGTQASTLLCHRFDTTSPGMHLIAPLMSAKEVLVFDFRNGRRNGDLARTLWMDDAFHPTVAAADMDNDGMDELVVSKLSGLYVFNVLTGEQVKSVQWTSNGERHRNYGLLQLIDVNGDGAREAVIVAERVARHIAVVGNDGKGNLSLLWDRFIEFIYPDDTTELRHTGNSVQDVDGDGRPELVVCLFNARKDGCWWLEVIDPVTGAVKAEMKHRYLWGVQDVDGDGVSELLIGTERQRNPLPFSSVEVVSLRGLKPVTLWSCLNARFAGRGLRPAGWRSNFRPVQFGHDESWTDTSAAGTTLFYFTRAADGVRSLAEATWKSGRIATRTTGLGSAGEFILSALADVDGDGVNECVLSENNGRIIVARAEKGVCAEWTIGFRLQLEGFSAARPGPVPVVYRASRDPKPFITIPDNTNRLHQLQVDASGRGVTVRWSRRGRGWMGYDNSYHSAYVRDVDGDGECEILAVNPERTDCSELVALAPDGSLKKAWLFRDVPPPAHTRIGLYEWVVAGTDGDMTIAASAYASYSMNSERTIAIDLENNERWRRVEYGEGEWGRGVGPWSAPSVVQGKDGRPHMLFLAKDLLCRIDAFSGEWVRDPWILWRATNSVMNQPDWDFTKDRQADFGSEKDPFTAYGSPIVLDADRDGKDEILIAGCFGGFGVLRDDYGVVWWMRTPFTDMMLRLPGIADVHGDGRLCIGTCRSNGTFLCLEAATGKELWHIDLGTTTADVAACDIDGDGKEEFIAGTTDGRLIAIGTDGAGRGIIRWSIELGFTLGNPVVADANGDGMSEILVACGDGTLVCVGKGEA
jgi:outer membrane protein assembly factor BamB